MFKYLRDKIKFFWNKEKENHKLEIEKKKQLIDEVNQSKEDSENLLCTDKIKLDELKIQMKEQSLKIKEEKKNLSRDKKQLKQMNKKDGIISSIIIVFVVVFGAVLLFTVRWLFLTWPNLKMDELMYQLSAPTEGTSYEVYIQYFIQAGIPTIIVLLVTVVVITVLTKGSKKFKRVGKMVLACISVACILISFVWFDKKVDAIDYFLNKNEDSSFIQENYVDPTNVEITFPEEKRNVITIYCESMEITYSDVNNGGGFENDIIPNLTNLSESNENFSGTDDTLNGAISLSGTTWTMGGLFASTSGLPLIIDIDGNDMSTQSSFFSETTVLGDILEKNGYTNVLSIGSDGTFGGRSLYFGTHGDYDIRDINYRKENGQLDEDYCVFWGFEDQKLFEFAKEDLNELSESDEPFNYTMLTVDTHPAEGYFCEQCEDEWDGNQYANVMSCSDRQISEFVEWAKQQDWYENTTIVITGDHPTMNGNFCSSVSSDYQRRVYTTYINAQPIENESEGMREYSTFDTFPTTLSAMGVSIEGDKLGLGTNLFSGLNTLIEEYGVDTINYEFSKNSNFLSKKAGVVIGGSDGVSMDVHVQSYDNDSVTYICDNVFGYSGELEDLEIVFGKEKTHKSLEYVGNGTYSVTIPVSEDSIELAFNIVTLDEYEKEISETVLEYSGNPVLIDETSLTNYLNSLTQIDTSEYTVFVTAQGENTKYLTEEEKLLLGKIGAGTISSSDGNAAFAVIGEEGSYTKTSSSYLQEELFIDDSLSCLISSSIEEEIPSSILLGDDYVEYSLQEDGLNFVVWDNKEEQVISQCAFPIEEYRPFATVSLTKYKLKNNVEVSLGNLENFDNVNSVVAVLNDDIDPTLTETKELQMNADGVYVATFEGVKNKMSSKTISVYAVDSEYNRTLLGTITHDSK